MFDSYNPAVLNEAIQKGAGGGGGTTVVANPEGVATTDLTKLQVGETVYGIPVYAPVDFSTSEVNTGVKWIDGKELYRKVISFTTGAASTYLSYDTGITGFDTIFIDYAHSFYPYTGNLPGFNGVNVYTGVSGDTPSLDIQALVMNNQGEARVDYKCGTNASGVTVYITLLYTKATVSEAKKSSKKK